MPRGSLRGDVVFSVQLEAFESSARAGPKLLQALAHQSSGEAAPQQEGPQLLNPPLRLVLLVEAPVLLGQGFQNLSLRHLLQGFGQASFHQRPLHPTTDQFGPQAMPAQAAESETAAGEALRITPIVQVASVAEPLQGGLDLVSAGAPAKQRAPELLLRAVPPGQQPQGAAVGGGGGLGSRAGDRYSVSKDCMVFSISSAAMSEVDWMPWIFSLNSSGLLARRSASS